MKTREGGVTTTFSEFDEIIGRNTNKYSFGEKREISNWKYRSIESNPAGLICSESGDRRPVDFHGEPGQAFGKRWYHTTMAVYVRDHDDDPSKKDVYFVLVFEETAMRAIQSTRVVRRIHFKTRIQEGTISHSNTNTRTMKPIHL